MSRALTLPPDYAVLLADLKAQVRSAQLRAHRVVNTELLGLYWRIGDAIRVRQEAAGWGAKVIDQLAADLRAEFPEMTGLRRTNVYAMRAPLRPRGPRMQSSDSPSDVFLGGTSSRFSRSSTTPPSVTGTPPRQTPTAGPATSC